MVGKTTIAWLWARTVKCPNPACGCQMPLVSTFQLSTKKAKEAWIEPIIDRSQQPPIVNFEVKTGKTNRCNYFRNLSRINSCVNRPALLR